MSKSQYKRRGSIKQSNAALEKSAEADSKYDACVEATENANKSAAMALTLAKANVIYYGTEEPTAPTHPIWINPENDANGEIINLAKETAELTARETMSSWIEEGDWPLTLLNIPLTEETSTVQPTYTTEYAHCHYFAIGNLVYVQCDAKFIMTNEGSGYACINGLPFLPRDNASFSVGEVYGCIEGGDGNGYTGFNESHCIRASVNNSYAQIYGGSGGGAIKFKSGAMAGTEYENCLWIKFSGSYIRR